jgi:serine protease AprX
MKIGKLRLPGAIVLAALIAAATAFTARATDPPPWQQKVDAAVLDAAANGQTEFFVYLDEQADLSGANDLATKSAKGQYVYETLTSTAGTTQAPVIAALEQAGAAHRSFWVTNSIVAEGGLAALEAVASLSQVEHVYGIGSGALDVLPGGTESTEFTTTVFDSIALVDADDAWTLGYRGQGAVVAGADTGVRWTHEALKDRYRGWDGTSANHDYDWHDAIHVPDPTNVCGASSPTPCDDDTLLGGGHGTHTVGTMVGSGPVRGTEKNEIGMAPDAKWIACRNMAHGLGVIPTYLECMEWFLAPTKIDGTSPDPTKSPDVINNSWGCVEVCPPPALQDTLRASRAAGIFYAVSAGNDGGEGPVFICSSIYHPLARYPEAFSVGATTWTTDSIADFSSRGPVLLGDPPNQLLLRKPNISAPGVSIRSALRANDSRYGSLSGTSMAGPHVAGLVALIVSANPTLAGNVDRIEDIIEQTAVPKTTAEGCGLDSPTQVPNNTYGWGRINALAAVERAIAERADLRVTGIQLVNHRDGSNGSARQNDTVTVTATVANTGGSPAGASKTEFLLDGTTVLGLVDTGSLAPGASTTVSVTWNTRHVPNGVHQIRVTADRNGQVLESSDDNNSRTAQLTIRGNKVQNGSFEDDVDSNGTPDSWSGQSTGAGSTSTGSGGSHGQSSAQLSGNGGSALLYGSPNWTSAPISVTAGEVLDLEVSVRAVGASSPASAGLAYLGPLGEALGRATLLTSLGTPAFSTLEQSVTIPAGVAQVRVVLTGFAPTDSATTGTVAFDDVGLYAR